MRVSVKKVRGEIEIRSCSCGGFLDVSVEECLGPLRDRGLTPQFLDESAFRVEHLYSMVAPVRHVNIPVIIKARTGRPVKLTFTPARPAVRCDELSIRRQLLHAVVAPIGNEDVAIRTDRDPPRQVELSHGGTGIAKFAHGTHHQS